MDVFRGAGSAVSHIASRVGPANYNWPCKADSTALPRMRREDDVVGEFQMGDM